MPGLGLGEGGFFVLISRHPGGRAQVCRDADRGEQWREGVSGGGEAACSFRARQLPVKASRLLRCFLPAGLCFSGEPRRLNPKGSDCINTTCHSWGAPGHRGCGSVTVPSPAAGPGPAGHHQ